jgi:uncharacterized protein
MEVSIMVKRTVFIAALALIVLLGKPAPADEPKPAERSALASCLRDAAYDEALAKEFGADEYGMKKYVLAFLKRGPNRSADAKKAEELQAAHLKNIGRMSAAGKLVLAGPFLDDGELRGIYIFNVATVAEAEALTRTDPAIQAGSLVMELKEWYGSAALVAVNGIHSRLAKEPITGTVK